MLNTRPGVGNGKQDGVEKFEGVYIFKKQMAVYGMENI
jgi:hypothetical protein